MKINKEVHTKFFLWFDLDGVCADIHYGAKQYLQKDVIEDTDWYPLLRKTTKPDSGVNFFLDLPILPDTKKYYNKIKTECNQLHIPISFLTSISQKNTFAKKVKMEKMLWVINNIDPYAHVQFARETREKPEFIKHYNEKHFPHCEPPIHILIDDYDFQNRIWTEAGGKFIHHINWEQSYQQFKDIING